MFEQTSSALTQLCSLVYVQTGLWYSRTQGRLLIGFLSVHHKVHLIKWRAQPLSPLSLPCYISALTIHNSICLLAAAFISVAGTFITMDPPSLSDHSHLYLRLHYG